MGAIHTSCNKELQLAGGKRVCSWCGDVFAPTAARLRHCSDACERFGDRYARNTAGKGFALMLFGQAARRVHCAWCGRPFRQQSEEIHCSAACRQEWVETERQVDAAWRRICPGDEVSYCHVASGEEGPRP